MKTLTATEYMTQLLNGHNPFGHSLSPDEAWISWPFFLNLLQQYCLLRGWEVEFDAPHDYSCAIFCHDQVSRYQLPLFPDCPEVQSPWHRFMSCNGDFRKEPYDD